MAVALMIFLMFPHSIPEMKWEKLIKITLFYELEIIFNIICSSVDSSEYF